MPPALQVKPVWIGNSDGAVHTGDRPFWRLHGHRIYSRTHENHPSALWAQQLGGNYKWLWRLALALTDEYEYRYGRKHKSLPVIWALEPVPPSLLPTVAQWSEAPPAMDDAYKVEVKGYYDTVASYRRYYNEGKRALHQWTKRPKPAWIT